ncbi:hypothetical protein J2T17_004620 [Paenibacillus mucilaginosus]|uniref:hypothetical protein n=1 Tax=Paenibacillus mucilaginosus TaxID=61624 RepID=UPI003D217924
MSKAMEQMTIDSFLGEAVTVKQTKAQPVGLFQLNDYDVVILYLSGGAESMGCLFQLKK